MSAAEHDVDVVDDVDEQLEAVSSVAGLVRGARAL